MNTKLILIAALFFAAVLATAKAEEFDEERLEEWMDEEEPSDLAERDMIDEEEDDEPTMIKCDPKLA
ncbi:hypothetical protein TrispH2_008524 [Trichoplax sp. H2]|nr:hypothetical protein TrispH2_008524 [Trichoplax sp. H2]|eukprot:RDD38587.1 hypothetical protein TrispH2_008524 [Trichoplax sp. H2]